MGNRQIQHVPTLEDIPSRLKLREQAVLPGVRERMLRAQRVRRIYLDDLSAVIFVHIRAVEIGHVQLGQVFDGGQPLKPQWERPEELRTLRIHARGPKLPGERPGFPASVPRLAPVGVVGDAALHEGAEGRPLQTRKRDRKPGRRIQPPELVFSILPPVESNKGGLDRWTDCDGSDPSDRGTQVEVDVRSPLKELIPALLGGVQKLQEKAGRGDVPILLKVDPQKRPSCEQILEMPIL